MVFLPGSPEGETRDLASYGSLTNDASRVFLKIDVEGTGFLIENIKVNINNQVDQLLTKVDGVKYALDSKIRPNPDKYGVVSGIPLQKNFPNDPETAWLFSITLSDLDLEASCGLNVMAYMTLVCDDEQECDFGSKYEAFFGNTVVNENEASWFSYHPYEPCGLHESVGGGHCKPGLGE
jgi:hypothetical protein